jgi:hypothetical protein
MTTEDLWRPDEVMGKLIRVGEWLYDGRISLAARLFKSDTRWGSGYYEDPPEICDDQAMECYYLDLRGKGDRRIFGPRPPSLLFAVIQKMRLSPFPPFSPSVGGRLRPPARAPARP